MSQKYVYNPLTCEYDIINEGAPGVPGPRGPVGPPGPAGANGVGVPTGGTTGQVLAKASDDDFDTEWVTGGGGGGGDLQSVLNAGNSATGSNREIQLAPGYIQLMGDINMMEMDPSLTTQSGLLVSSQMGSGQAQLTNDQLTIEDGMSGGEVALTGTGMTITAPGNSPIQVQADPMAAMGGTFLFPDAYSGSADTIATREWVAANYSGGGGGPTPGIDDVLSAGNYATNKMLTLSATGTSNYIELTRDGINVNVGYAHGVNLRTDPALTNPGTLFMPSLDYGAGSEVIATREWVAANYSGGGGSVGTLSQVLLQGNQTNGSSIVVNDSSMPGEQIEINAYQLLASGPNGATTVSPNNINLNSMMGGSANISLDGSSASSNQLSIVDNTYPVETIATREWVSDNAGGGGGGAPDLDAVLDQGSVANNKTVWLGSDSSGMTTIQPGDIAFANDAMDESGSMSAYSLSFNSTPADEYSLLGANQLQFTSNANSNMSMLGAGSLVLAPDTNDSNTVLTSSEVLVGDGANERVSIGTYPEAELRMSSGVASLTVDVNGLAIGGTLHLPDPEGGNATVATREYVFPVGSTAGRTSYEQNGRMYIDTDLGQPIWYVAGTGWIDATGTGV